MKGAYRLTQAIYYYRLPLSDSTSYQQETMSERLIAPRPSINVTTHAQFVEGVHISDGTQQVCTAYTLNCIYSKRIWINEKALKCKPSANFACAVPLIDEMGY